jgi:uncharacterized protein YecA (UPF0149 family)
MENKALSEQIKKEGTPDVIIIQDEDGHVTQKMIDLKTTNKKVLVAGRNKLDTFLQATTADLSLQAQKEMAFIKEMIDQDLNRIPKSERRPAVAVRNSKEDPKIQRNEPCPCGSSKKYKHCCINVQV